MGISRSLNEAKIGKTLEVIVDGIAEGGWIGRSASDAPEIDGTVIFRDPEGDASLEPGDFVKVHIDDAFDYDLTGTLVR